MTQIKKVKTSEGVQFYPQTHTKAVVDDNGNSVESVLQAQTDIINAKQIEQGDVEWDIYPTAGSYGKVASSGGVFDSLHTQETVDLSSLTLKNFYVGPQNLWVSSQTYCGKFLPVKEGEVYTLTPPSTAFIVISILKSTSQVAGSAPDFSSSFPSRIVSEVGMPYTVTIPSDAHYIYVRTKNNGEDITPTVVRKGEKYAFLADVESLSADVDSLTEDIGSWDEKEVLLGVLIPSCGASIASNTGNWVNTTGYYAGLVDVEDYRNKKLVLTGGSVTSGACYTFTTAGVDIGNTPAYATGYGAPRSLAANTSVTLTVPSNAKYLYVYLESPGTSYRPQSVAFPVTIGETLAEAQDTIDEMSSTLNTVCLDTTNLYQGGTNNKDGNTNTLSDCVRTAKFPLGSATSVIIYNNKILEDGYRLKFKFSWYNSSGTYQSYTTWQYGTEVEVPSGALGGYVIIVFTRRNSSDVAISSTTKENIAQYKLYLNIYGSLGLEDRVANLEDSAGKNYSYIDDISKGLAPKSITICTWNIGHFALGVDKNSTITGSTYATKLTQFRDLIYNTINPRVIALNEYSAAFGTDSNSVSHNAKDVLFNDFGVKFEGLQDNYSCNALYGNTYLANIEQHSYACLPHEIINQQAQIYADNYYYVSADLYLEGRLVKLIVTHMAYGGYQDDQCNELITLLEGYDRAVIIGDLNINGDSQTLIDCFDGTGYTIGNSNIDTYPSGTDKILDNIIYKGVVVSDVRAITSSLSDHYPLVCTVTV